jgi:hypothetical protein
MDRAYSARRFASAAADKGLFFLRTFLTSATKPPELSPESPFELSPESPFELSPESPFELSPESPFELSPEGAPAYQPRASAAPPWVRRTQDAKP